MAAVATALKQKAFDILDYVVALWISVFIWIWGFILVHTRFIDIRSSPVSTVGTYWERIWISVEYYGDPASREPLETDVLQWPLVDRVP